MMAVTVYLTVLSGYLAVAYLVGAKLTRTQLVTITALFVAFALLFSFGSFGFFLAGVGFRASDSELAFPFVRYLPTTTFVLEILGIIAAIKFMTDIRKGQKG